MKKYLLIIFICIAGLSAQISGNAKTKLQSLGLPGWGEQSLGESKRAQGFFIRETALWLIFLGGEKAADWYESDYRAFAGLHADVSMAGKNYLFAVNLGHYDSFEEYNDLKERKRLVADKYKGGEGLEWQWDNKANRIKFDKMRINSGIYRKYAKFAVGGLVLHRLISFFDVIYLERKNLPLEFDAQINADSRSLQLKFSLNL